MYDSVNIHTHSMFAFLGQTSMLAVSLNFSNTSLVVWIESYLCGSNVLTRSLIDTLVTFWAGLVTLLMYVVKKVI